MREWKSELEIKWTSELVSERVSGWVDKRVCGECVSERNNGLNGWVSKA